MLCDILRKGLLTFWVAAVFHESVWPLAGTSDGAVGKAGAAGCTFRCALGAGGRRKRRSISERGKESKLGCKVGLHLQSDCQLGSNVGMVTKCLRQ